MAEAEEVAILKAAEDKTPPDTEVVGVVEATGIIKEEDIIMMNKKEGVQSQLKKQSKGLLLLWLNRPLRLRRL